MAAIKAYVPRNSSLPPASNGGSPSPSTLPKRPQAYVPRSTTQSPSASDSLKNDAEQILKLLAKLPAPLTSSLPKTFVSSPRPASQSSIGNSKYSSFKAFARALKRKSSDEDESNGLGLSGTGSTRRPELKRARTDNSATGPAATPSSHELTRSLSATNGSGLTPPSRAAHLSSPHRQARSSLRHEIKERKAGQGTANWTKQQWNSRFHALGTRAHSLKRYGDAFLNPPAAKGHLRGRVSEDPLRAVLYLTDSLCLYLFRVFCEERHLGYSKTESITLLDGLRIFILGRWQSRLKTDDAHRDLIHGMIGFIYLVEAVTQYQISQTDLSRLSRRANALSTPHSSSATLANGSANGHHDSSAASNHGPSPASSSASPGTLARSPASSTSEIPQDVLKLLTTTASASNNASKAILQSRHYLSLRTLRDAFPTTWDRAVNSDLSEDIMSAPGDSLGCARHLDIDDPDTFAWPIELGMQNAIAHVAVFGRALVREFSEAAGKPWEVVLTEADSPDAR